MRLFVARIFTNRATTTIRAVLDIAFTSSVLKMERHHLHVLPLNPNGRGASEPPQERGTIKRSSVDHRPLFNHCSSGDDLGDYTECRGAARSLVSVRVMNAVRHSDAISIQVIGGRNGR
jgi:hypothetical protein